MKQGVTSFLKIYLPPDFSGGEFTQFIMNKKIISLLLFLFFAISSQASSKLDSLNVSFLLFHRQDFGDSYLYYKTADMNGKQRLKANGAELVVGTRLFGVGIQYDNIGSTFYREAIPQLSLTVPEMISGSVAGLLAEFYPVSRDRFKLSLRVGALYGKANYLSCVDGYAYYEGSHLVFWKNYIVHKKHGRGITFGLNLSYRVYSQFLISLGARLDDYKTNHEDWDYLNQNNMSGAIMISLGVGYMFN